MLKLFIKKNTYHNDGVFLIKRAVIFILRDGKRITFKHHVLYQHSLRSNYSFVARYEFRFFYSGVSHFVTHTFTMRSDSTKSH